MLRDTEDLLEPAVRESVDAIERTGADAAARRLAIQYAALIDTADGHCRGCEDRATCGRGETSGWAMRWIGPLLLDTLAALGATPAARAQLAKGGKPKDAPRSRLQGLRDARGA